MRSVAVIVPTYNRLPLLRETAASLHAQTLENAEFLIVDDGSHADTLAFLESLPAADSRFRIIAKPFDAPRGAQGSRNVGLDAASADGVVFLDSDDLLEPDCLLERYREMIANPHAGIIVGRQAIRSPRSGADKWVNVPDHRTSDLDRFLAISHPIDVPWVNGGVLLRMSSLVEGGIRWRPEFHWDDVAFHFECLVKGLATHWMSRDSAPDSFYLMHDDERYGAMLSTEDGLRNSALMIGWMLHMLREANMLSEERRRALAFSFFNACVLRAIDDRGYRLSKEMLNGSIDTALFSSSELRSIAGYLKGRSVLRFSPRATYYWNRIAETAALPQFFTRRQSTYGTIPAITRSLSTVA